MSDEPLADIAPDEGPVTERLRVSSRSILVAVGLVAATIVVLRMVAASTRVIGWLVAAVTIASLLQPLVAALSRWLPRALAVLAVVVVTVGSVGLVGYGVVHTLTKETRVLQRSAPRAASRLEHSKRYGELARNFELAARTRQFVAEVPARLRGGTTAQALRAAATRGVAFLATGVLSLFFLLYGPRLVAGALAQFDDERRRRRLAEVGGRAYRRTVAYASGTVLMAVAAGLFAYLVASVADVPGAAALAVWVGLWDVVPLVGAAIGAVPIVLLALVASGTRALVVGLALVGYQAFEYLVLQRRAERASVHLGPFLTVVGGLAGIEVYGIGGGLVAVLALCLVVAVLDEVLAA
jgi:predicted PurR-regulated permease PerM